MLCCLLAVARSLQHQRRSLSTFFFFFLADQSWSFPVLSLDNELIVILLQILLQHSAGQPTLSKLSAFVSSQSQCGFPLFPISWRLSQRQRWP